MSRRTGQQESFLIEGVIDRVISCDPNRCIFLDFSIDQCFIYNWLNVSSVENLQTLPGRRKRTNLCVTLYIGSATVRTSPLTWGSKKWPIAPHDPIPLPSPFYLSGSSTPDTNHEYWWILLLCSFTRSLLLLILVIKD